MVVLFPGRAGDIGRLEDALAAARLAESSARAELMEAERTKQAEVSSLSSALETARSRTAELQARLLAVEEDNEKLLQERQVSTGACHLLYSSFQPAFTT